VVLWLSREGLWSLKGSGRRSNWLFSGFSNRFLDSSLILVLNHCRGCWRNQDIFFLLNGLLRLLGDFTRRGLESLLFDFLLQLRIELL